jgi:hypothetical protein
MEAESRKMFGGDGGRPDGGGIGMSTDFMTREGDVPLVSVLMWQQSAWPMHPEDLVDGLLAQVRAQVG